MRYFGARTGLHRHHRGTGTGAAPGARGRPCGSGALRGVPGRHSHPPAHHRCLYLLRPRPRARPVRRCRLPPGPRPPRRRRQQLDAGGVDRTSAAGRGAAGATGRARGRDGICYRRGGGSAGRRAPRRGPGRGPHQREDRASGGARGGRGRGGSTVVSRGTARQRPGGGGRPGGLAGWGAPPHDGSCGNGDRRRPWAAGAGAAIRRDPRTPAGPNGVPRPRRLRLRPVELLPLRPAQRGAGGGGSRRCSCAS